jgi:hypothetical protein
MPMAPKDATITNTIAQHAHEPSASTAAEPFYLDDGLLSVAGPIIICCYVLLFSVAAITFIGAGEATFAVLIGTVFALVFFTIPVLFMHICRSQDPRWRKDHRKASSPTVEVATGTISRWEAIIQIVSVPVVVAVGFTLLALRWSML